MKTMSFFLIQYSRCSGNTILCLKEMKRHFHQYIVMFPICKFFYMLKTYEKYEVFSIDIISPKQVIWVKFFPTGEIGNLLVKFMLVNFLHQVNCKTKYTIPEKSNQVKISNQLSWMSKTNPCTLTSLFRQDTPYFGPIGVQMKGIFCFVCTRISKKYLKVLFFLCPGNCAEL